MNKLQCIKFLVLLIFRSISKITVAINNAILDNEAPTMFIILKILNYSMMTFSLSEIRDPDPVRLFKFLPIKFWIKNFFFQSNFCLNTLLENICNINFLPINFLSEDDEFDGYNDVGDRCSRQVSDVGDRFNKITNGIILPPKS